MTSEGQNGITEKPEEADVLLPHQTPSGDLECNHAEHDIYCVHRTSLKDIPFVTIYAASKFIRLAKRSAASRGIPRPCSNKSLSGSRSTTDSPGHIHSNVPCHRRSTSRSPEKKMKPFFATPPSETASDQRKLLDSSASSGFVVSSQCLGNIASPDRLRCHLSKHLHPSYLSVVDDDRAIGERLSEIDYDIQPPTLKRDIAELGNLILNSYLNIFLIFVPVTIISKYCNWPDTATFVLSCFAMIPLASMLADFTEEVACHSNQCIAGLVNASFGNAVEVVVALQALRANQIRIVQASLIGSVFSNMLLVLGCCFFFGGLQYTEQHFNITSAHANISMLLLSSMALLLPIGFSFSDNGAEEVLNLSRASGICLLLMYIQLLFFQLGTYSHLFNSMEIVDLPKFTLGSSIVGLAGITVSVAFLSNILVESIDGFIKELNISTTFVGIIIIPIIGNAVEHVTAVTVAVKGKLDLAIGVAIGSATQISMFVVPVAVLAGWVLDKDMTLSLPINEVALYIVSVLVVGFATSSGTR